MSEVTSKDWSVEAMVQNALEDYNEASCNKAVMITLRSDERHYAYQYFNQGMNVSEMVTILETVKSHLIRGLTEDYDVDE